MARHTPTGYWWTGRPNFGDLLTPLLLQRFAGLQVTWSQARHADIVAVGSVLDILPPAWPGIVAGAGKLREGRSVDLSCAAVLALRGPLTARGIKGDYVLGDPGLLADELVQVDKEYNLGIVPHWSDAELEHRPEFQKYDPRIIRPDADPLEVIREIGRCRKIVASSLHGLIVADAFGIPRRTEMCAQHAKEGGNFKFRDHSAAVGLPYVVGVTQEAPRYRVQDLQHGLFDVLGEVGDLVDLELR